MKRRSLKLFEAPLLLKVKRSYWNIYSIGKSIEKTGEDNKVDTQDRLDMENDDIIYQHLY